MTWIGSVGGGEQRERERHVAGGDRSGAAGRRTRPAPGRTPSGAPRRSRSSPHARTAGSTTAVPVRRGRRRVATAASSATARRGRGGRGRPARSRRRGTAPATRRACRSSPASETSGHSSPNVARRNDMRARSCDVAGVHGSTASLEVRTRADERVRGRPARRRPPPLLAEAQRVEAALDSLDEVVRAVVPLQPAVLDHAGQQPGRSRPRRPPRRGGCGRWCACRRGRRRRRTARRRAGRRRRPRRPCRCAAGTGRVAGAPPGGRGTRRAARRRRGRGRLRRRRSAHRLAGRCRPPARGPGRRPAGRHGRRGRGRTRWRRAGRGRRAGDRCGRAARRAPRRRRRRRTTASRDGATTIRASRGWTGRPTIERPAAVMAPASSTAPRSVSSSIACRRAFVGGSSTNASCSAGVPHAASSSTNPARSTWVISAARWAGRVPCSMRLHSRYAAPGSTRPARPARCSAESRLIDTVVRRVMPVPASKRGARASPLSTTTRTPSTVSDVSAMSVASTTRRRPGGDGASARSCSSSDSAPASGGRRRPGRGRR